jgi:hypothetical protein
MVTARIMGRCLSGISGRSMTYLARGDGMVQASGPSGGLDPLAGKPALGRRRASRPAGRCRSGCRRRRCGPAGCPAQQARAAVDDPSVSPTLRWPPNSAAPPSSMTWPAASCTDTEPSGLNTNHQTVTAWPACSPVVRSEKDVPLPVRVRVEVPTGLVVWVAAPARLTTTTDSGPRGPGQQGSVASRRFPPCGSGTGQKGRMLEQFQPRDDPVRPEENSAEVSGLLLLAVCR